MVNAELIKKGKTAASPDELMALAEENGITLTPDEAKDCFAQLSAISDDALDGVSGGVPGRLIMKGVRGELSEDELENVSGGGCYNKGELVVTVGTHFCKEYLCKYCKQVYSEISRWEDHNCDRKLTRMNVCGTCTYCKYKNGLWKCTNPKKRKG